MSTHNITVMLEADTAYDDVDALVSDIKQAIDNEEDVTLSIAGNTYHVGIVAAGDAVGGELP